MQRRFIQLLLVICMAMFLFGCVHGQYPSETGSLDESADLNYDYFSLGFSLSFPESWAGRVEALQNESFVTVSIDGIPTYCLTSLTNDVGAREKDQELEEEGYNYYCQNGTTFFYYQQYETIPKELCPTSWRSNSAQWCTEKAMLEFWRIVPETEVCTVVMDGDDYYFSMKTSNYIDHRLGISFAIPDIFMRQGDVYVHPTDSDQVVSVVLLDEQSNSSYLICSFLALRVEDPFNNQYCIADSPDLLFYDGKLYGGVNEWRHSSWRQNTYTQFGWETYPASIRNTFSYGDVQEMVNSFQLLFPENEIEAALEMEQTEIEKYISTP